MKFLRFLDRVALWFTPTKRRYTYRVANAAVFVVATYGLIEGEKLSAFGYLLNAVLGMADWKVPSADDELPSAEVPVEWEEHDDRLV